MAAARAVLLAVLFVLPAAPVAEAQSPRSRPRIIWDVPPEKVIRIATLAPGGSARVDVPFHATGDLDRTTRARDIFRTTVLVDPAVPVGPVAPLPAPPPTATPLPSPTPQPTATRVPRPPVLGWGRQRPLLRPSAPPRSAPSQGERSSDRGRGFVRP